MEASATAAQEQRYIAAWKELLRGFAGMTGFAVFSHGSVVILKGANDSEEAARAEALEVMKRYGPVFPGSEAGDFNTTPTKGRAEAMRIANPHKYFEVHEKPLQVMPGWSPDTTRIS